MELSVIIPVWNKIALLPGLLDQLRHQSFSGFECLLIDDGSTDGSGAVCDAAAREDRRFRVIHTPNGGVSQARNLGLDAARGEYITFLDSDDGIGPDYLAGLLDCARRTGAELVITGFEKARCDGTLVRRVVPRHPGVWRFDDLLPDFCAEQRQSGIYGYAFGKLFPRRLLGDTRFDERLRLAEDFDFYLKLYAGISTVCLDDGTGYRYRVDTENGTGNTPADQIDYLAQLRIHLRWRELLRRRGAWSGENQRIVEDRMGDYAFFVLFHTPPECFRERFDTLYGLCRREEIPLSGGNWLRRWLFFCLRRHRPAWAKITMALYRALRKGLGRPCC